MPKALFSEPAILNATSPVQSLQLPAVQAQRSTNIKPMTMEDIGNVGSAAANGSAQITTKITGIAKTSDMDELGTLLMETIKMAKGYDPASLQKSGLFGFFKSKISDFRAKFDTVDSSVNQLVTQIDQRIALFKGRIRDLEQLAVMNQQEHDKLTGEIAFINERADWMENNVPVVDPNDGFASQRVQDWNTVIDFARKRADDLRRLQMLMQQQAAQITQMKQNSGALAQKFSDLKTTTIPALKQTFTLYVINLEQAKGAEFADVMDETTNKAIQDNAAKLGQNTTKIMNSLTRSNISVDTLKANQDAIINSLNEVERIRSEMKMRLTSEAPQIEQLSRELSARLAK